MPIEPATDQDKSQALEFFKIEYEKCLELIHKLHEMRFSYQKFYVSISGTIIAVAVVVSRFIVKDGSPDGAQPKTTLAVLAKSISNEALLGFIFIVSAIVGYFVVRNLISIRRNEVYWTNFAIALRKHISDDLRVPTTYPTLGKARAVDFHSADFQTIIACTIINFVISILGGALLMDGASALHSLAAVAPIGVIFLYLHISSIRLLRIPLDRGDHESAA
jgi:hypothetical protein